MYKRPGLKWLFWAGLAAWLLFELLSVYLIMPFPGSQEMESLGMAYFLYQNRLIWRMICILVTGIGFWASPWSLRWLPYAAIAMVLAIALTLRFRMSADKMFRQPQRLTMADAHQNTVDPERLVIGIERSGAAKAYPIRFLAYHHQVMDTLAGMPIMVTYCNVCRTGRVFEPEVDGVPERFRLVGMDQFNAMFEDARTGSWWRQATGEAVAGPLKGKRLPELFSAQTSLASWIDLHPDTRIMQADPAFERYYDTTFLYEKGRSRKKLTGTDSLSWRKKSWVIGITHRGLYRAYDWNQLVRDRLIQDTLAGSSVFLVVSGDSSSFFAFENTSMRTAPGLLKDTIVLDGRHFRLDGTGIDTSFRLRRVSAYQEFWHSWESFHPEGTRH